MMDRLRDMMNKSPWVGWATAGVLLLGSIFMFVRGGRGSDPYSPDRMKESVTIKFTDTGDEITMTRGQLDREMRRSADKLDAGKGIINPKTGQPTGFPFDKDEWDQMISRINEEKQEFKKAPVAAGSGAKPTSAPRKEVSAEEANKLLEKVNQPQPPALPGKK